MRGKFNQKLN